MSRDGNSHKAEVKIEAADKNPRWISRWRRCPFVNPVCRSKPLELMGGRFDES